MDASEIPEAPEGAKIIHDDCGRCKRRALHIESRLTASPIGSFSLAGAQGKTVASHGVVLVCRACGLVTPGNVDAQGYASFPDHALNTAQNYGISITITGSRTIEHSPRLEQLFRRYLEPQADHSRFMLGGARGLDSHALVWLAENTQGSLLVVVPDRLSSQPDEAQRAYERACRARSGGLELDLVELGLGLRSESYHKRNRWMVDRSRQVFGFVDRGLVGGTGSTVRYANGRNKPANVIPV